MNKDVNMMEMEAEQVREYLERHKNEKSRVEDDYKNESEADAIVRQKWNQRVLENMQNKIEDAKLEAKMETATAIKQLKPITAKIKSYFITEQNYYIGYDTALGVCILSKAGGAWIPYQLKLKTKYNNFADSGDLVNNLTSQEFNKILQAKSPLSILHRAYNFVANQKMVPNIAERMDRISAEVVL